MRDLASVERIQKIEAIPDKDRIELATVANYTVIVQKGEYKEGDLCVYCFYDTILPQRPEFEFLRARCYNKLYDAFRVRNMKMAGCYSSGIVFPLSILGDVKITEGMNVEKILGVKRYAPEELHEMRKVKEVKGWKAYLMRFKFFRRLMLGKTQKSLPYPATVQKSDETNIQKLFNSYKNQISDKFYKTEKMEGQAGTWLLLGKKRKYYVYSHNVNRKPDGSGNWEALGRELDIENRLRKLKINYAIQGEICGPGIQGNIYNFPEKRLFVYKVTESDTGKFLNYKELVDFCKDNGFEMVPILEDEAELPETLEDCLKEADGYSVFGKKVKREGIVWRSMTRQSIGFKAKSREYAIWFDKQGIE